MIRFRNTCRAFEEDAKVSIEEQDGIFRIIWNNNGVCAELSVDFVNEEYHYREVLLDE